MPGVLAELQSTQPPERGSYQVSCLSRLASARHEYVSARSRVLFVCIAEVLTQDMQEYGIAATCFCFFGFRGV